MEEEYYARLIVSRFALPCMRIRLLKGKMSQDEYNSFEERCISSNPLETSELEKLIPNEYHRRQRLAQELGEENPWSLKTVSSYWSTGSKGHNQIVDSDDEMYKDSPESFREACKVHEAKVIGFAEKKKLVVSYDNKQKAVHSTLVPNAKIGDTLYVHLSDAIFEKDELNALVKNSPIS